MKGKIMFVMNCGTNHDVMISYLIEAGSPTCFGMVEPTETYQDASRPEFAENIKNNIVIFNDTYNNYATTRSLVPANCLTRAWQVPDGNAQMVAGDISVATRLIRDRRINYLAYDDVKNAFWTLLP